jgi:thiol-disulfide isomerase/thioredoxin
MRILTGSVPPGARASSTRRQHYLLLVLLALGAVFTGGCERFNRELQPGIYRATLTVPGGELPFGLDVAREEKGPVLYLVNGEERVRVPAQVAEDGTVTATVPGYETTLTARVRGRKLTGEVTMTGRGGVKQTLRFAAERGTAWRFYEEPATDNVDVAGRWEVTFKGDDGTQARGVAEFAQRFEQVTGTMLLTTGDQRYLAGEVHGDQLRLSRFDGGSAYLYHASVNQRGELVGEYWSGNTAHRTFVAVRNPDAELDTSGVATDMRDGNVKLQFTFPDLDGKPMSLADPRFAGKVVIVALDGSWCPNCHDEARLLMELYRRYRAQGLEIVSLMFEHHGDFERAAGAARKFRDDLGVEYPMLIAGTTDRDDAATKLPQLTGIHAFPTTIFLDRNGHVRKIRAGFWGPATGLRYDRLVAEWTSLIESLLAEGAAADPAADTLPPSAAPAVPGAS